MIEFGDGLTITMPTPPASLTARLLSVRATTPRSQSTILPTTLAGSSEPIAHWIASMSIAVAALASSELTSGAVTATGEAESPWYTSLPIVSVPAPSRLWVPAAVVMIHGLGCATVETVGPELPADAVTKTFAAAAFRNETSTELVNAVDVPLIE